jgi:hypothetical protein
LGCGACTCTCAGAWYGIDDNLFALVANLLIIDVEEATRAALPKACRASKSEISIAANRPSTSKNSPGLSWWSIELKLVVGDDRANAALGVSENTIPQMTNKSPRACTLYKSLAMHLHRLLL